MNLYEGYGMQVSNWNLYYGSNATYQDLKSYVHQLDVDKPPYTFTMELDMTQTVNDHGVL